MMISELTVFQLAFHYRRKLLGIDVYSIDTDMWLEVDEYLGTMTDYDIIRKFGVERFAESYTTASTKIVRRRKKLGIPRYQEIHTPWDEIDPYLGEMKDIDVVRKYGFEAFANSPAYARQIVSKRRNFLGIQKYSVDRLKGKKFGPDRDQFPWQEIDYKLGTVSDLDVIRHFGLDKMLGSVKAGLSIIRQRREDLGIAEYLGDL